MLSNNFSKVALNEHITLLNNPGNGGTIGFGNILSGLSAYKLQPNSPALQAGIVVPFHAGDRDYYGSTLPSPGTKIAGAHQY